MTDILDFAAARIGRRVRLPQGEGQCVDLVNDWLLVSGQRRLWANAIDLPKAGATAGLLWTDNAAANFPSPGDIVVWLPSRALAIPAAGHTAICIAANGFHLLSLDQNWPEGSLVRVVLHGYGACLGWLVIPA